MLAAVSFSSSRRWRLCVVGPAQPLGAIASTPGPTCWSSSWTTWATATCRATGRRISIAQHRQARRGGMRFERFYANCPVCSPTRASLLSGRFPDLVGVPGVIRTHSPTTGATSPRRRSCCRSAQAGGLPHRHRRQVAPGPGLAEHAQRAGLRLLPRLPRRHDGRLLHPPPPRHQLHAAQRQGDRSRGHATDLFTQWAIDYLRERRRRRTSRSSSTWPTTPRTADPAAAGVARQSASSASRESATSGRSWSR